MRPSRFVLIAVFVATVLLQSQVFAISGRWPKHAYVDPCWEKFPLPVAVKAGVEYYRSGTKIETLPAGTWVYAEVYPGVTYGGKWGKLIILRRVVDCLNPIVLGRYFVALGHEEDYEVIPSAEAEAIVVTAHAEAAASVTVPIQKQPSIMTREVIRERVASYPEPQHGAREYGQGSVTRTSRQVASAQVRVRHQRRRFEKIIPPPPPGEEFCDPFGPAPDDPVIDPGNHNPSSDPLSPGFEGDEAGTPDNRPDP